MIYITGDTHGERARITEIENNSGIGAGDFLIVCGDFGYIFKNNAAENSFLDGIEEKPYTLCFCDGNHENFTAIEGYPEEIAFGGKVHRIRKNIFHLMRGQIFEMDGKKIFTMGGAYSVDKYLRAENISWWSRELPSNEEYKQAACNLEKHGKCVDYIITHTAPTEIVRRMGHSPNPHDSELCGFLEWVMYETKFEKWFFGHWHTDGEICDKIRALYYDVERVEV